jgi:RNA polymerase sporulation-specific sigma factor
MNEKLREIIFDNRNLIFSIIHRFKGDDYDDLYQAGCLGIINAYKSYNDSFNVKFTTYAYPFIVGEIYKYLVGNRNIHMSPMNIRLSNSIKKAEEYLTNHLGRSPTDEEIATFLEIDLYKISEIRNMQVTESLDYQYEDTNLYNFIAHDSLSKEELIDLRDALNTLSDEEKSFIKARYFHNITQSELAKIYHTNQVKISREEKKVLCKLKAKMY